MESYGVVRKSSLAEIFDHSSCAICQSILRKSCGGPLLPASAGDSAAQIKEPQCTLYSAVCDALVNEKQLEHSEDGLTGSTLKFSNHVEGKEEIRESNPDKIQNNEKYVQAHSFLGSSLYYGGRKDGRNEVKMAVRQLEEAMDPFYLEYTTRGNWWQGSLYY